MPAIKLHVYRGNNPGMEDCDFRGEKFIGHEQGDEHRTVLEIDPAATDAVALVLLNGPKINEVFERLKFELPTFAGKLAALLGLDGDGDPGLRIGVWDD